MSVPEATAVCLVPSLCVHRRTRTQRNVPARVGNARTLQREHRRRRVRPNSTNVIIVLGWMLPACEAITIVPIEVQWKSNGSSMEASMEAPMEAEKTQAFNGFS